MCLAAFASAVVLHQAEVDINGGLNFSFSLFEIGGVQVGENRPKGMSERYLVVLTINYYLASYDRLFSDYYFSLV